MKIEEEHLVWGVIALGAVAIAFYLYTNESSTSNSSSLSNSLGGEGNTNSNPGGTTSFQLGSAAFNATSNFLGGIVDAFANNLGFASAENPYGN